MAKFSRIRYPSRRQRRLAFRTSSIMRAMEWGILHKTRLQKMSDNIFRSTPLLTWLERAR